MTGLCGSIHIEISCLIREHLHLVDLKGKKTSFKTYLMFTSLFDVYVPALEYMPLVYWCNCNLLCNLLTAGACHRSLIRVDEKVNSPDAHPDCQRLC